MKKLFTLVIAACASLSVSAVEKDVVTTPIVIEATQGDDGLKWAETEAIILKASDVAVNDFLKLTVTDAEAGSGEQNVLQFKKADSSDMYYGSLKSATYWVSWDFACKTTKIHFIVHIPCITETS